MKTRNFLYVLALSFGLFATTSCSNEDNDGETIVPIQGKYELSQTGEIVNGKEVLIDAAQNQSGCSKDYLELKLSNVAVIGDYSGTECNKTETTGTYVRSHNDLTLTFGNLSTTSDIMNLTNKELKLKDKLTGAITVYKR
ncbi:lipocalin family protein [Flavobacterium flavigenum]|uniref:lipocalin family protein n=1 Tax=Flavobacterium flavigenum TaxID=3003258 RepID=UPI0022AC1F8D|nr:lipocalin family protein [Flavobacterium flavigenum]